MTRRLRTALIAALALGAVGATAFGATSVVAQSRADARSQAAVTLTPEQARAAALRAHPGATAAPADESIELETEDGRTVYEVEITLDGREMDVMVDAETGDVLASEADDDEADDDGEMEDESDERDDDEEVAAVAVPRAVTDALRAAHPGATDVEWELEDDGFEAEFSEGGSDISVVFASSGTVEQTETEIAVADLPSAVRQTLGREYAGRTVTEAARIVAASGAVTYEAELDGGTDVLFDASGRVVATEAE